MQAQTVTVIGLGHIGASIGLAVKASSLELLVIGHDRDRSTMIEAETAGAVDKTERNLVSAAELADILVLALPLPELEETLKRIGKDVREHTLVLDLGSLKGPGLKWAQKYLEEGHYVGAGPVLPAAALNDGRSGIEAARADLFQKSVFCFMPSPKADPKAVETAVNFGRLLGATPYYLDPFEYDGLVQGVETLPGLLGAALFRAVTQSTGWRDILRFAGLPFARTTSVLENEDLPRLAFQDKIASLRWLDAVLVELQQVRRWIAEGDAESLDLILQEISLDRARWLHEREQNNWVEVDGPGMDVVPNIGAQLFGMGGLTKKEKDSKKRKR